MIELTGLEVNNNLFNITEENNKFTLSRLSNLMIDEGIYETLRTEVRKNLGFSDITPQYLLFETKGPIIIDEHRKT